LLEATTRLTNTHTDWNSMSLSRTSAPPAQFLLTVHISRWWNRSNLSHKQSDKDVQHGILCEVNLRREVEMTWSSDDVK
jgi:hypothetical protein